MCYHSEREAVHRHLNYDTKVLVLSPAYIKAAA